MVHLLNPQSRAGRLWAARRAASGSFNG